MSSQVQKQMIRIALKSGNGKLACKLALLAEAQPHSRNVILADAYSLVRDQISSHQWAGYLSALREDGFYSPVYDADYKGWGTINRTE